MFFKSKKMTRAEPPQATGDAPHQHSPVQPPAADNGAAVALTHVWVDAPNAVKLKINRMLLPLGDKKTFENVGQTGDAPLAKALFAVEGVISVELESAMITVFMDEDGDWENIIAKLTPAISEHFTSGQPAIEDSRAEQETTSKKFKFGFKQVPSRTPEEQMQIIKELLDSEINPAVASHGGFFTLIDVQDNNVYVQLGGGCQGCGMADVTLRQGVEQRMKEVLPEMVALIDTTDHAAGNNPYYQAGK
ncbi:MAG: NifU family protein [SAR324 cluster bacterium]|nr:NifU family protein [SAR324 cluster bacterium]MCZ6842945.1 NifU family protein [SAR324 cluster bacterium]